MGPGERGDMSRATECRAQGLLRVRQGLHVPNIAAADVVEQLWA